MQNNKQVTEYLIANRDNMIDLIIPLKQARDRLIDSEDYELFRLDVQDAYEAEVKAEIVQKVTKALAIDSESVLLVLEAIELDEYLSN